MARTQKAYGSRRAHRAVRGDSSYPEVVEAAVAAIIESDRYLPAYRPEVKPRGGEVAQGLDATAEAYLRPMICVWDERVVNGVLRYEMEVNELLVRNVVMDELNERGLGSGMSVSTVDRITRLVGDRLRAQCNYLLDHAWDERHVMPSELCPKFAPMRATGDASAGGGKGLYQRCDAVLLGLKQARQIRLVLEAIREVYRTEDAVVVLPDSEKDPEAYLQYCGAYFGCDERSGEVHVARSRVVQLVDKRTEGLGEREHKQCVEALLKLLRLDAEAALLGVAA